MLVCQRVVIVNPSFGFRQEMQQMVVDEATRENMEQNIEFIDWWGDQLRTSVRYGEIESLSGALYHVWLWEGSHPKSKVLHGTQILGRMLRESPACRCGIVNDAILGRLPKFGRSYSKKW